MGSRFFLPRGLDFEYIYFMVNKRNKKGRSKGRPVDLVEGEMRERLLRTAARLFAESGYAATSVQAIVDAAGATKPMVYYYFQSKEGLYRELVTEAFGRIRKKLEGIQTKKRDIEQALVAVVEANFELFREAPEIARFSLMPLLSPTHNAPEVDVWSLGTLNYRLVRRIVSSGMAQGELCGDPDVIAMALMGQIAVYQIAQQANPGLSITGQDAGRNMVSLLLEGARVRPRCDFGIEK